MSAWLIGGADAIQKDVEDILAGTGGSYRKTGLDEKLRLFLITAASRMASGCGVRFDDLRPHITDFISFGASIYEHHHTMDIAKKASMLGLSSIELHSIDLGGASLPAALEQARRLCENEDRLVLIAGAEVPRGGQAGIAYYREVNDALLEKNTELHTHTNLISLYALMADRLMFEEGISSTDVEAITEFYRNCALENPRAANYGKKLRDGELQRHLAGCYATPMVAVATDHGVAFLVASDTKRAKLKTLPGFSEATALCINAGATNSAPKYLTARSGFSSPAKLAASRAFARTGITAHDIDYAWVYDCFTLMLVRQAADYFCLKAHTAAKTLQQGFIEIDGTKKIRINRSGGILNTQAAISLSAASGLLDIMDYATEHLQAQHFFFGGNGGLDTINAVAILSRQKLAGKPAVTSEYQPPLTSRPAENGETLTLYAAVMVRFNPGTDVPFALGAFRRADGSLFLAHMRNPGNAPVTDVSVFARDEAKFTLHVTDTGIYAVADSGSRN